MIRPVNDGEYFGDEDAVFRPFTPAGVASILGFPSVDAMLNSAATMRRMTHLFNRTSTGLTPAEAAGGATRVFHSTRTRQPWRQAVAIPTNAMPRFTMAMDERTTPLTRDVEAIVIRTPELPQMTAPTFAVADAAAQAAARGVGAE
jgi:hypothetical protein